MKRILRLHTLLIVILCFFQFYLTLFATQPAARTGGEESRDTPKTDSPKRIVSLIPSLTEAIYLLGIEDRLVANTTYCITPEAAKLKEKVGTLVDINVEKVITLKPDIVLTMEFTDNKTIEKLRNLGLRVELFGSPKNFDHLCESFIRLAEMMGVKPKAIAIVDKAKNEVAEIRNEVETSGREKLKIFWQLGAKPLYAATKRFFTHDFIDFSGSINITADAKSGVYSREAVVSEDPDVIIIVTMGILTDEEVDNWKLFKSMKAVRNNRIYVLDAGLYCRPTPQSFPGALRDLIQLLYGSGKIAAK